MIDYNKRIANVRKIMQEDGIDALFLPSSGDAEYLTGIKRDFPEPTHTHADGDWLNGAFITCDKAIYAVSRMTNDYGVDRLANNNIIKDLVILEEGKDCLSYMNKI